MNEQYWSYLLTVVGVTGFILAGKKIWWCWYINIACQGLWLAYALVTQQYGFLLGVVVYSIVFSKNAIAWTREHKVKGEYDNQLILDEFDLDYNKVTTLEPDWTVTTGITNRVVPSHLADTTPIFASALQAVENNNAYDRLAKTPSVPQHRLDALIEEQTQPLTIFDVPTQKMDTVEE